jgi:hypothetical protein
MVFREAGYKTVSAAMAEKEKRQILKIMVFIEAPRFKITKAALLLTYVAFFILRGVGHISKLFDIERLKLRSENLRTAQSEAIPFR